MDSAREARNNPTEPEARLWARLSNRQLGDLKFRRQYKVNGYRLDFFCPALGLAIEVDGHTHDAEADAVRDHNLLSLGFTTLRFTNTDVMQNVEGVCERILEFAQTLPPRVWGRD